jgi:hypothetical protein
VKGKILFVAGAAAGYVLGARAGRKRYEQIAAVASKVWNAPPVQAAVGSAQSYAGAQFGRAADLAFEGAKGLVGKALGTKKPAAQPAPRAADVATTIDEAAAAGGSGGSSSAPGTSA